MSTSFGWEGIDISCRYGSRGWLVKLHDPSSMLALREQFCDEVCLIKRHFVKCSLSILLPLTALTTIGYTWMCLNSSCLSRGDRSFVTFKVEVHR